MLCRAMRRRSSESVWVHFGVLFGVLFGGCVQHGRDLDEFADQWAEAVCERWTECGCPVEDCTVTQRQEFIDRWEIDNRVPIERCFDDRVEAIREVSCDHVERTPFEWEQAACPLAPTFRGLNEPCVPPAERETFRGACEHGLVCDAVTRRCFSPSPAPIAGQPCLRAGHDGQDDWLCADELVCDETGVCVDDDEMLERTPPPPLVCDGLLSF
jgi:hypothetical protein